MVLSQGHVIQTWNSCRKMKREICREVSKHRGFLQKKVMAFSCELASRKVTS